MKDKIETSEIEVEGLELVDLGDAAEETRQFHPIQMVQDSTLTWGRTVLL